MVDFYILKHIKKKGKEKIQEKYLKKIKENKSEEL